MYVNLLSTIIHSNSVTNHLLADDLQSQMSAYLTKYASYFTIYYILYILYTSLYVNEIIAPTTASMSKSKCKFA